MIISTLLLLFLQLHYCFIFSLSVYIYNCPMLNPSHCTQNSLKHPIYMLVYLYISNLHSIVKFRHYFFYIKIHQCLNLIIHIAPKIFLNNKYICFNLHFLLNFVFCREIQTLVSIENTIKPFLHRLQTIIPKPLSSLSFHIQNLSPKNIQTQITGVNYFFLQNNK